MLIGLLHRKLLSRQIGKFKPINQNARQTPSLFYFVFQEEIRNNVKPVMYVRMRLGEFDPPEMNPYLNITDMSLINCEAHRQVALDAAMKSFVLLKNNHNSLPLKKLPVDRVAVSSMSKHSGGSRIFQRSGQPTPGRGTLTYYLA